MESNNQESINNLNAFATEDEALNSLKDTNSSSNSEEIQSLVSDHKDKNAHTSHKKKRERLTLDELDDASNFDLTDISVGDLASADLSQKLREISHQHDVEATEAQNKKHSACDLNIEAVGADPDTASDEDLTKNLVQTFENGVVYGAELTPEEQVKYQQMTLNEGDTCPHCASGILVVRSNDRMAFLGCSNFPSCKLRYYSKHINHVTTMKILKANCPSCNDSLAVKKGRFGLFIGCLNYPECSYIYKEEKEHIQTESFVCPECNKGHLNQRRSRSGMVFYGCDRFPNCNFSIQGEPIKESCPACNFPLMYLKKNRRKNKITLVKLCPNKNCSQKLDKAAKASEKSRLKALEASKAIYKEIEHAKRLGVPLFDNATDLTANANNIQDQALEKAQDLAQAQTQAQAQVSPVQDQILDKVQAQVQAQEQSQAIEQVQSQVQDQAQSQAIEQVQAQVQDQAQAQESVIAAATSLDEEQAHGSDSDSETIDSSRADPQSLKQDEASFNSAVSNEQDTAHPDSRPSDKDDSLDTASDAVHDATSEAANDALVKEGVVADSSSSNDVDGAKTVASNDKSQIEQSAPLLFGLE